MPLQTPDYHSALVSITDTAAIAAFVSEERARLRDEFLAAPSGAAHSQALTRLFDAVIRHFFAMACADARAEVDPTAIEMAILATGGYGRRELCPRSDIDISFVAAEEEDPYLDAVVRRMFFLIMDVFTVRSDLKVGYAFRVPDECADLDPQTRTALLDARVLAGSGDLAVRFHAELLRTTSPAAFFYSLQAERERARAKAGGSIYRTEPDLKEGVGSLRDLHFTGWVARVLAPGPVADPWAYLVESGELPVCDGRRVQEAREFLLRARHALHYAADRAFDSLTRTRQEEVAPLLGYQDPAALMAEYYRHAEVVHAAASRVAIRARKRPLPLDGSLLVLDGEIGSGDHQAAWGDLAAAMALFRRSQGHTLPLHPELGERVAAQVGQMPDDSGAAGRALLEMLAADSGIEATLRQMTRWGVLQRLIPEFGEALRLVPPAAVHDYTVGEHALQVVGFLEQARRPNHREPSEHANIFAEIHRTDVLFLSALLHDLGKRTDPKHHAETGAGEAQQIALRLGLEPDAAEMVAFLVRHHLLMTNTARLRDLTQEQTIRDFIAVVDSVERLNKLFLLTWADVRATGGGVWSPVQDRFLEELYFRSLRALAAPEPEEDLVTRVQRRKKRMQRELTLQNLPPEAVQEHCNAMPPGYILNTPVETIARHIRLVERLKAQGPVVEFVDPPDRDYTMVTLCTYDDPLPGLLSKIAAALYAHNINVYAAQVLTRDGRPGIALDSLWVASDGRRLRPFERAELERDLQDVMAGRVTAEALLRRQGRLPNADLSDGQVHARNDLSETHTVLEVRIGDRRGLLYCLTHRLSELHWDIHAARINTIGGDARDAFYVTDEQGNKLPDDEEAIRMSLLG